MPRTPAPSTVKGLLRVATGLEHAASLRGGRASGPFAFLRGRPFGVLTNPTAVDGRFVHLLDLLAAAGLTPDVVFAPEHGLHATAQDMEPVSQKKGAHRAKPSKSTGPRTRHVSLYGDTFESLSPQAKDLKGIEVLVYDIQDVGSRYYTFAATLVLCMKVCAALGIEVVVLDRPDPLGRAIEGTPVEPGFESFVGLYSVPQRHGLTVGELAAYANAVMGLGAKLTVLPVAKLDPALYLDATTAPWVMPSPNMPTLDTAIVYPGGCLYEGTNLSEGRGTTRPFELVGAPYLDAAALARTLNGYGLAGVVFRPAVFVPKFQKWAGEACGGVQFHVTDRTRFAPLLAGIAVLKAAYEQAPQGFKWRTETYEFISHIPAIDLLAGGTWLREGIEAREPLAAYTTRMRPYERRFAKERAPFLLYR